MRPTEAAAVTPPVAPRINFRAFKGAGIDVPSFRATYGFLGLDITDEILRYARIDAEGLAADHLMVPAGRHRITLSIADTLRRVGTRTFQFVVR